MLFILFFKWPTSFKELHVWLMSLAPQSKRFMQKSIFCNMSPFLPTKVTLFSINFELQLSNLLAKRSWFSKNMFLYMGAQEMGGIGIPTKLNFFLAYILPSKAEFIYKVHTDFILKNWVELRIFHKTSGILKFEFLNMASLFFQYQWNWDDGANLYITYYNGWLSKA